MQTLAQITIHGKRRGRDVDHDRFTETVKETESASKSKFTSLGQKNKIKKVSEILKS